MIKPKVKKEIERIVRARMGRYGLRDIKIQEGKDQDSDDVLFVEVEDDLVDSPLPPSVSYGLIAEVRDAIEPLGEVRFPHVRHKFHEKQQVAGVDPFCGTTMRPF